MQRFILLLFVLFFGLTLSAQKWRLIDKHATRETVKLYKSLRKIQKSSTVFGHQNATEYGRGWSNEEDRSDVKSVVGEHPGVIGIDVNGITRPNAEANKARLKKIVEDHYNRDGIITVAWHFSNPMGKGGFNWQGSDSIEVVKRLIPGGDGNEKYKVILDSIAEWFKSCKGSHGELVPMIFRPYHEFDGGWFWWGANHCTVDEFVTLWKFTVQYLRDEKGVHNLIWAFSPDNKFIDEAKYTERYPGNDFVDLLGMDNYGDMGRNRYAPDTAVIKLNVVSDFAKKNKKLSAFTESGLESIPNPTWWTETLLKVMKSDNLQLCYVLVWRNDQRDPKHYYAPYPGQPSAPDFIKFYNDPYTLFVSDLKKRNIYKK
jgi:mannan endo-1,4-beta-mannosidase